MAINKDLSRDLGRPIAFGTLLAGAVATGNGTWFYLGGTRPVTVTVEGTFAGTIEIDVSNAPSLPANTEHGAPIVTSNTVPSVNIFDTPFQWIKARVTAYTSGSINVYVLAG